MSALRAAGASVEIIGEPVDLLVGYRGRTVLVEAKNLDSRYGKRGLNKNQREFCARWLGGPVCKVTDAESAIRVLSVIDGAGDATA